MLGIFDRPLRVLVDPSSLRLYGRFTICVYDDLDAGFLKSLRKMRYEQLGSAVIGRGDRNERGCNESDFQLGYLSRMWGKEPMRTSEMEEVSSQVASSRTTSIATDSYHNRRAQKRNRQRVHARRDPRCHIALPAPLGSGECYCPWEVASAIGAITDGIRGVKKYAARALRKCFTLKSL